MKDRDGDIVYYQDHRFPVFAGNTITRISVVNDDTFTLAADHPGAACLNFASHKRPGGGYEGVMNRKGPIRTQEEDLFRRSDLPALMDNNRVRTHYPMADLAAIYCVCTVSKDKVLDPVEPFTTAVVTVPAVVDPNTDEKLELATRKAKLILDVAADNGHETVILGAWGCGVFNNDPQTVAEDFKWLLNNHFRGVFGDVFFAIPTGPPGTVAGRNSNHQVFQEVFA